MIKICDVKKEEIKLYKPAYDPEINRAVRDILSNVEKNGDAAVFAYAEKFDRVHLDNLVVSDKEFDEAVAAVPEKLLSVIENAAKRIYEFHRRQVRESFVINEEKGIVLGQKILPIERVGLYVPGGTAAYPSSVIMNAVPAKIAGVPDIAIATPPGKDGRIAPAILAAAKIVGVTTVYKMGGAQAVAALAYGTESVRRVDKIVGPGNVFVAEAKRQVFGTVSIDMIAGPSEILVIADDTCDPVNVAADLLSQAEHDRMASAVLITDSEALAAHVSKEIERQIELLERRDIARASIDDHGKILLVSSLSEAVEYANRIAPEHLEICCDNPFDYLGMVKNAGSVFLGKNCPEALGDYYAGPNHTLPTSGTARFSSPLSVDDFIKKTAFTYYTKEALGAVADDIDCFARAEGLTAHARSVTVRFDTK